MPKLDATWRKSTRSNNNGSCVEARRHELVVQVRDTKQQPGGPVLTFTAQSWTAFLAGTRDGEFDRC